MSAYAVPVQELTPMPILTPMESTMQGFDAKKTSSLTMWIFIVIGIIFLVGMGLIIYYFIVPSFRAAPSQMKKGSLLLAAADQSSAQDVTVEIIGDDLKLTWTPDPTVDSYSCHYVVGGFGKPLLEETRETGHFVRDYRSVLPTGRDIEFRVGAAISTRTKWLHSATFRF